MPGKMQTSRCRVCKKEFKKAYTTLQIVCSPKCALEKARKDNEAKEKRELREAKERIKTRNQWMTEAQREFNKFIRLRDEKEPCICCGQTTTDDHLTGSGWDAGHYLSTGARPELRFNEDNCHKQLAKCNRFLSGNAAAYRVNLVKKLGIEKVEWLEGPHESKKYTIGELKEIKALYKQKQKDLKNG